MDDLISRQAAIRAVCERECTELEPCKGECESIWAIKELPSVQPEGWLEKNKDKILQAGMEGREIDFRIGGRLFAIREKAQ